MVQDARWPDDDGEVVSLQLSQLQRMVFVSEVSNLQVQEALVEVS